MIRGLWSINAIWYYIPKLYWNILIGSFNNSNKILMYAYDYSHSGNECLWHGKYIGGYTAYIHIFPGWYYYIVISELPYSIMTHSHFLFPMTIKLLFERYTMDEFVLLVTLVPHYCLSSASLEHMIRHQWLHDSISKFPSSLHKLRSDRFSPRKCLSILSLQIIIFINVIG